MDTIETVKIVAPDVPGGHIVINKHDLTDEHELFETAPEDEAPENDPAEDGADTADKPRRGRPRKAQE